MRKLFSLIAAVLFAGSMMATEATMSGGSAVTVNGKSAIKVGAGKSGGSMTITVGSGATSLSFYIASWSGDGASVSVAPAANVETTALSPTEDASFNGSASSFTLTGEESTYFTTIALSNITTETEITLSCSAGKNRFIVWGATYEGGTPTCATPTFDPEDGETFEESIDVEISAEDGTTIYYTTDGTAPTTSSSVYSTALHFTETTTLKAMAAKAGSNNSSVATATYTKVIAVHGYAIDFENDIDAYVDWEFENIGIRSTAITAHGGSYYAANVNGSGNGVATASITTKAKVATPGVLTFYISKESGNTTASSWVAQVSADGTAWTDVETFDAKGMNKGNWDECTADLSSYTNVFVRISYGSSNAIRAIDDIELAMANELAKPTISGEASFLTSTTVTISHANADAIYYTIDGTDPTTSSTLYSAAFTLNETATVKAIAVKGSNQSAVASKEFTKIPSLETMDEIFAAATTAGSTATSKYITFNNWVVSGVTTNGKSVYLTDGTKGLIIFDNGASTGFSVGDILSGTVSCKVQLYNGSSELTSLKSTTEGLTVTTGGVITPVLLDADGIEDLSGVNTGSVITVNGACTNEDTKYYVAGVQLYNSLYAFTNPTAGKNYTATGVYAQYGETKEIMPRSDEDILKHSAVTFSAPEHGTLVVKNGGVAITSGDEFEEGTVLTVEAEPENINYKLNTLNANSSSGNEDIRTSKQFTVGTSAVTVIATFVEKPAATISWENTADDVREYGEVYSYNTWKQLNNVGSFNVSVTSSNTDVIPSMQPYGNSTNTTYWFPTSIAGTGTTTITATFAGNDNFRETSVSYDVIVKAASGLAWSAESADVRYGADDNEYPTLTNTHSLAVTYSSSNTDFATISNEEGHEGEITLKANGSTTITASFAGDETYAPKEVSYTLNVSAGIVTVTPDPVALDLGEVLYGDVAANYGKSFHLHIENLSANKQIAIIMNHNYCYPASKWVTADGNGVIDADVTMLPITNLAPRENPYVDNIEVVCTGTREFADIVVGTVSMVSVQAYAITVTATTNGSVTLNGAAAPKVAKAGTTFTLATTPAEGYVLDALTITDGEEADIKAEVLSGSTLTMPASAMIITATFKLDGGGTALDNAEAQEKAVKFIENNQIFIRRGDKTFNAQGQLVK